MAEAVGIDLGTSNVRVCVRGKGIVLRTPCVIARKRSSGDIIAYGMKAREMLGKTPESIQAIRPVRGGVIADGDVAATLLSHLFRQIGVSSMFSRPHVLVTVPSGVTAVERRAVEDAAFDAGARSVTLLDASVAAAVGAGLPVSGPRGCMIADIGGGTAEASVLSLGGVVSSSVLRKGGDDLDAAIVSALSSTQHILIGDAAAERLKLRVGAAVPGIRRESMTVTGRGTLTGLAMRADVTSDSLAEATAETVYDIAFSIKQALGNAPPELAGDVMSRGLVLTGGSSLLPGLGQFIGNTCGVRVFTMRAPLDAAAAGLCRILENPGQYRKLFRPGRG